MFNASPRFTSLLIFLSGLLFSGVALTSNEEAKKIIA